jgi:RNA polymerase sigma-70 factor (ECF subfamily)
LHICQQHARSAEREARGLVRMIGADGDAESPNALDGLVAEERRRGVHRALVRLRAEDRELLRLLYFQDLEPEEVARQLGLTPGALRVRKHRALQRLAELVGDRDV